MALFNQSDVIWSIMPETTFGEIATSGTRYELPVSTDQAMPTATATAIASVARRPNRASNGSRRGMVSVTGSLDMRLSTATAFTPLFESALSSKFDATTGVLKTGSNDSSFTLFANMAPSVTTAGQQAIEQFTGCMANGFTIDAKANDGVTVTFDIMGVDRKTLTTDNTTTVTPVANDVVEFVAEELKNLKVAGQELAFSELSFQTSLSRNSRPALGRNTSLKFGVNGSRETTITVKAYRESYAIDALIDGSVQEISFDVVDDDGNGFTVVAACEGEIVTTDLSDGSAFANIVFHGRYDATKGTDLTVTKH